MDLPSSLVIRTVPKLKFQSTGGNKSIRHRPLLFFGALGSNGVANINGLVNEYAKFFACISVNPLLIRIICRMIFN